MHDETAPILGPTPWLVKRQRTIRVLSVDWADSAKRDAILRDARAWAAMTPGVYAKAVIKVGGQVKAIIKGIP